MGFKQYRQGGMGYRQRGSGVQAVQGRGEWGTGKVGVEYRQYRQGGGVGYRQGGSGVQAEQARGEWGTGSTGKGGVRYRQFR